MGPVALLLSAPALCLSIVALATLSCDAGREPTLAPELGGTQGEEARPDWTSREARRIRQEAGIPAGETAGVRPGKSPGPSSPGDLVPAERIRVESAAEAAALSTSGSGTREDPYLFADLLLTNSESVSAPYGFSWVDDQADYFVALENSAIEGYATAQILVSTATELTVRNVRLASGPAIGSGGLWIEEGNVVADQLSFEGLGHDGVRLLGTAACSILLEDCRWSDDGGPWGPAANGFRNLNTSRQVEVTILHGAFDATSLEVGVLAWQSATYRIENCSFRGGVGIRGGVDEIDGVRVRSCRFETRGNGIRADRWTGWDIGHSEFRTNDAGHRQCRLIDCGPGRAHHNRFTKTTGSGPGNECLESFDGRGIVFEQNWVTECVEDAFEHVRPKDGCSVRHCVGDAVGGQIVDYFGNAPAGRGEIHHIFGDCRDVGVLVTDVDSVEIHSIFTDNRSGRWSNVTLEQRHTVPGEHPRGCRIHFPLPAPGASAGGSVFGTQGVVGPGNRALWIENGTFRRFSS